LDIILRRCEKTEKGLPNGFWVTAPPFFLNQPIFLHPSPHQQSIQVSTQTHHITPAMFKCNLSSGDCVEGGLVALDPVSKVVILGAQ
jgi:hypothetical protein